MSFRGRGENSDKKLRSRLEKRGAFDVVLDKEVDVSKIDLEVMAKWITEKLTELLGFEDEVVIGLVTNVLRQQTDAYSGQPKKIDAKELQIQLTGFLEKEAGPFVNELWTLLIDAQDTPHGIPRLFIQRKKEQLEMENAVSAPKKREPRKDSEAQNKRRRSRWDDECTHGSNKNVKTASAHASKPEEKIVVRHLLIKHRDSRRPKSWRNKHISLPKSEARTELEGIRTEISAASNPEAALAKFATERSDCPSATKGGLIAPFRRGDLDRDFEQASFALRPDHLSEIVDTPSGLHLILRKHSVDSSAS